jgi:hypothetical protein
MPPLLCVCDTALHAVALPFQALQVLMQHSDISSNAKAVCSLLQTCRSWQGALQQCSAGNLSVCIGSAGAGQQWNSIQQLSLFCSWLRRQPGLVQEICLFHPLFESATEQNAFCNVAEQLLVLSLQEAAGRASTSPSAAAAAAAAAAAPAPHSVLQLRRFSTNFIRSAALLHALPAAALTQLRLQHSSAWRSDLNVNSSSIAQALAQLSSLRSLTLKGHLVGNACLAEVGKLAQLTYLDIGDAVDPHDLLGCDLQLLPVGLQEVHVKVFNCVNGRIPVGDDAAAVALGHLTALRTLELETACGTAAGSSLPPSLTALTLRACMVAGSADSLWQLGIHNLPQLQRLQADRSSLQHSELLAALSNLAQLTHISLTFDDMEAAARAAPAWSRLTALQSLYLQDEEEEATLDQTESLALAQGLAAATSIRNLEIQGPIVHDTVQLCAHVTGLTQLQQLEIRGAEHSTSRAEALRLTALTNLTKLCIVYALGVDDTAASALAVRLTKLQDLQLWCCNLWSAAVLPVIASLTGLTNLLLTVDRDMQDQNDIPLGRDDLLLLAPLTQLKRFMGRTFFANEAIQEMWDARLGQWRQQQQ